MIEVFDGHCDTLLRCYVHKDAVFRRNTGHLDLERMGRYGHYAQFFASFAAQEELPEGKDLWQAFLEQHAIFCREMEANRDVMTFCRTGAEAAAAWDRNQIAAFLSVEGAELLHCDIKKLRQAHQLGVRAINITWNHANPLSGSNMEEPERGLSQQGRAFVKEMGALGILVDVSHLSDPGFWDVVDTVEGPFLATHSNARDEFFHSRNLTDAQFTAIIKKRGVAGLTMCSDFLGKDPDLTAVIAHLEHFLALGGEENIALGGDWDGCSLPRGVDGIQAYEALYEALLRRNYQESLVRGVFHTNLMRVVSEVCSM